MRRESACNPDANSEPHREEEEDGHALIRYCLVSMQSISCGVRTISQERIDSAMSCDLRLTGERFRDDIDEKVCAQKSARFVVRLRPTSACAMCTLTTALLGITRTRTLTSLSTSSTLCYHGSMMSMFTRVITNVECLRVELLRQLGPHGRFNGHCACAAVEVPQARY